MSKTKEVQASKILNEVWDLLHNLEAYAPPSHQVAIRAIKPKIEVILYTLDIEDIDFPVKVKA